MTSVEPSRERIPVAGPWVTELEVRYVSDAANKAEMVKFFEKYTKTNTKDSEIAFDFMLPLWQSQKVPLMTKEAIVNVLSFLSEPKARSADPNALYDNSFLDAIGKQ